jgi:hypothetical protein
MSFVCNDAGKKNNFDNIIFHTVVRHEIKTIRIFLQTSVIYSKLQIFILLIQEYVCFEKHRRIIDDHDELNHRKPTIKIK